METSLTVIVKESKVPATVQEQVTKSLSSFFEKVEEWKSTIKTIVITDVSEVGKMKMAREGRLALRQMRLDGTEIVKSKREVIKARMEKDVLEDKLWLKSGQVMELEYKTLEAQLEEKEKFAEIFEANRKKQLHITRVAELSQHNWQDMGLIDLGAMDEGSYRAMLEGQKIQEEKRKAEIKKAEEEQAELIRLSNLAAARRTKFRDLGLVNFIEDFNALNFSTMDDRQFQIVLDMAETAKKAYADNQQKIKEAAIQAQSPISPSLNSTAPVGASDKVRLQSYATALTNLTLPGFATPAGREIYEEARGYISKVADRINARASKL